MLPMMTRVELKLYTMKLPQLHLPNSPHPTYLFHNACIVS